MARVIHTHRSTTLSNCVTPDGKLVVSGFFDGTIHITRIEDGELVRQIKGHTVWSRNVCVTPDGKNIISGSLDKTIHITRINDGGLVREIKGHTDWINSVGSRDQRTYKLDQ